MSIFDFKKICGCSMGVGCLCPQEFTQVNKDMVAYLRQRIVYLEKELDKYRPSADLNAYLVPSYEELLQENKRLREELVKYKPQELLRCPFCGAKAEAINFDTCVNYVGCTNSECDIRTMHYYEDSKDPFSGMHRAIEAWNKRVK